MFCAVLSRVMEDGAPVTNQKTKTAYREALLPLYEAGSRGTLTQALMELGAMVCVRTARRNAKFAPCGMCVLQTRTARGKNTPVKEAKKAKREEEKTVSSYVRRLPCRPEAGEQRTSRGALELPNGGEADAAQALCLRKGRMRAGGASQKCRAGACVHAHHLAHALLLYSMQGEKPGICLGERCAAQNGCGASDSVRMFVEEEYKKHPRTEVLCGDASYLGNSADLREGREARGQLLVGGDGVGHGAVVEGFVGVEVEIARAGEAEDRIVFSSPVSLHLSASSMAARMAWLDSGAGRIPSTLAKYSAASKTLVCSTARASMSPSWYSCERRAHAVVPKTASVVGRGMKPEPSVYIFASGQTMPVSQKS